MNVFPEKILRKETWFIIKKGKHLTTGFLNYESLMQKKMLKTKKMHSNNTSGYTGITQFGGKWQVRIAHSKMHICDTLEGTIELRKQLEISHGYYHRKCLDDN